VKEKMKRLVAIAILILAVSAYAADTPSIVVSNFYSALEISTNDAFMVYVAPSSDGKDSAFIRIAREVLKGELEKHQVGFEIIGEHVGTGFAVVVGNLYSRSKPMGSSGALFLVDIKSNWLLLPDPIQVWSEPNTNYTHGKRDVLQELEGVADTLKNKGCVVETERRKKLVK
jgi:hypothetical protein